MTTFLRAFCAGAALLMGAAQAAPVDDLNQLIDEHWANAMAENPFAGDSPHKDKLPSVAPEDHARRAAATAGFLEALGKY